MKCEDCQKVLEEYFDGELDERTSVSVRAHLYNCEACSRELEALKDEQNLYALYRRDVEVTPTLWAGVAARISEEKRAERPVPGWRKRLAELFATPRLSPALTFALLILAVGTTAGLMKYMQSRTTEQPVARNRPDNSKPAAAPKAAAQTADSRDGQDEQGAVVEDDTQKLAQHDEKSADKLLPQNRAVAEKVESKRVVSTTVGFADEASPDQLVREAEQKYRAAISLLARDAKRRRTLLEPDVLARFDQTLAAVDRTITETRRAVRQQPDDPVAVQYMLAAYAKKVEVLREMATYKVDDRDIQ